MSGAGISESQVRRLAHEVGRALIERRDRKVLERRRQLAPRIGVISGAVVEIDGAASAPARQMPAWVFTRPRHKEDKVACLATPSGPTFTADPCPEPPESFRCPRRI